MMPLSENQERQEVDETLEKARHIFESTKAYLKSTVAEARVIENKARYLLVLTLSVSFGLAGFLAITVGNESSPTFLRDLTWIGGALLLVLAVVSFVLMWNLLPRYKVHHPGSELRIFDKDKIFSMPLWKAMLIESQSHQRRINANAKLNERRGDRLKWSTYIVLWSLAAALCGFLLLWASSMLG